jgi:nicotinate dehydrogenase subunit B
MRGVTRNLAQAANEDIAAIAAYVVSLDTRDPAARTAEAKAALAQPPRGPAPASGAGALLYAGACAECHDRGRGAEGGALRLPLAIAPTLPTPSNLIHIVENGIVPNADERFAWMPSFAGSFSDEQLADLIGYVRAISGRAPWSDVAAAVRSATRSEP